MVLCGQVVDLWILIGSSEGVLASLKICIGLRVDLVLDEMIGFPRWLSLILTILDERLLRLLERIRINVNVYYGVASLGQYLVVGSGPGGSLTSSLSSSDDLSILA